MVGNRIKLGRLASALSLQELAEALEESGYKITRAALSKYETGKIVPNKSFLSALAQALDLDAGFFLKEDWPSFGIRLFRNRSMIPKQEAELMAYLQLNLEQRLTIDALLGIQPPPFDAEAFPARQGLCQSDIDATAEQLRTRWGNRNQVIASVCGLLGDNGWYIFEIPSLFDVESVSGIELSTGRPFLAFAHSETIDDTRFNIMKEVGYAYFQHDNEEHLEEICCCFSRAVLLPKERIYNELSCLFDAPDYRTLSLLKQRYGISKVQLRMRLQDLGLYVTNAPKKSAKTIERIQARKLMDSKLDPLYFYENPVHFKLRVMEAERRDLISEQEAATMLPKGYT